MRAAAWALALALGACGAASPVGTLRYADQPIVWQVDDRLHTPAPPDPEPYMWAQYYLEVFVHEPITEALRMQPSTRAGNVNALDEVPDSTWFSNRIGRYELTPAQVRQGPNDDGGPEAHTPWTIKSTKVGGFSPGFLIEDARGVEYVLKFDAKGYAEMETGADVVVQRILWACGYNVPEDYVVSFRRQDLRLADDAVVADRFGDERPMTARDLDTALDGVHVENGVIRGLASEFLPGQPIGGHPRVGTRDGDPNDVVPIEDRRDVRGLYVIYSWVDQVDVKTENTLDMYVEDAEIPGLHYVLHYLVDFGTALGVSGYRDRPRAGFAYVLDFEYFFKRLATLGIWEPAWVGLEAPGIPGVGRFEAEYFDPEQWTPDKRYVPFQRMDRFDAFWATKIILRFTREQLEAILDNARYSDPRASRYVVDTLLARRRKIARHWLAQVAPLDRFEVAAAGEAVRLCFTDLGLHPDVARPGAAAPTYTATGYDYDGAPTGWRQVASPDRAGRACLERIPRTDYLILRLRTSRGEPPVLVHLAGDRLIGLRRL